MNVLQAAATVTAVERCELHHGSLCDFVWLGMNKQHAPGHFSMVPMQAWLPVSMLPLRPLLAVACAAIWLEAREPPLHTDAARVTRWAMTMFPTAVEHWRGVVRGLKAL